MSIPEEFYILENFSTAGYEHTDVGNQWDDLNVLQCTTIIDNLSEPNLDLAEVAAGAMDVISPMGGDNRQIIQDTIDAANPGDTICVTSGVYPIRGNIHINKSNITFGGYEDSSPTFWFFEDMDTNFGNLDYTHRLGPSEGFQIGYYWGQNEDAYDLCVPGPTVPETEIWSNCSGWCDGSSVRTTQMNKPNCQSLRWLGYDPNAADISHHGCQCEWVGDELSPYIHPTSGEFVRWCNDDIQTYHSFTHESPNWGDVQSPPIKNGIILEV